MRSEGGSSRIDLAERLEVAGRRVREAQQGQAMPAGFLGAVRQERHARLTRASVVAGCAGLGVVLVVVTVLVAQAGRNAQGLTNAQERQRRALEAQRNEETRAGAGSGWRAPTWLSFRREGDDPERIKLAPGGAAEVDAPSPR